MNPTYVAIAACVAGAGLAIAGIYLLAGLSWALVLGSGFCFALSGVLFRGLKNAE